MTRFAPALLLALSAAWCGTLFGGATALGSAAAALSLLALVAWVGTSWRDPLRLGLNSKYRWLPSLLWVVAAVSAAASPVPRAGLVGLILLPAFLGLPGAVARCWREEEGRRQGLRAVALVVAGISLWALLDRFLLGSPRAAMPLGHHNLLGIWLATLLPLAVLPARERGAWRLLGFAAGLLGVLAVLASQSLLATVAIALEAVLGLSAPLSRGIGSAGRRGSGGEGPKRSRIASRFVLPLVILLAALLLQGPRLLRIVQGEDSSARARAAYFEAGREGFLARPLLGQGPGAAAWTVSLFLDPAPGVNPAGEAVGELHSLPLQLAYELGAPGLLIVLGLGGLFAARRLSELRAAADPNLSWAGLCGLVGAAVALLGTASLAVSALPLTLAVAAGAALAARPEEEREEARRLTRVYVTLAFVALAPSLVAQALYERGLAAEQAGDRAVARQRVERAVFLDPEFPLYRLRLALLQGTDKAERSVAAEVARHAAEDGHGLAALWTVAGILGQAAERPWAPEALQTACSLDPLSPFAPWFGMLSDPSAPEASRRGAYALLAEPRLAAAYFWRRHPDLLAQTLDEVGVWPGIDPVWTQALRASVPPAGGWTGDRQWLALQLDIDPRESVSLFSFRRRPWPVQWPVVPLASGPLADLRMGPATSRPGLPEAAFAAFACAPMATK